MKLPAENIKSCPCLQQYRNLDFC